MLSLLCLLNVYETSTTVSQTTETKASSAKERDTGDENNLSGRELTPSLPSRLGELESIAVTHGAEKNHRQRHQSQLHSPGCLFSTQGPPCERM